MIVTAVHAVTDERVAALGDLEQRARALARAGASLHARGHHLSGRAHWHLACLFASCAPRALFVNDRLDEALAIDRANAVVPERGIPVRAARRLLGPDRLLGASTHDAATAARAAGDGADFVLFGPIFPTSTHPDAPAQGLDRLAEVVRVGIPVIAIGGITMERVLLVREAGAAGVAAIRALWEADDPGAAVHGMQGMFDEGARERSRPRSRR